MAKGIAEGQVYWDNLKEDLENIKITVDSLVSAFDSHTHKGDGSQAATYQVSVPDSTVSSITPTAALTTTALPSLKS